MSNRSSEAVACCKGRGNWDSPWDAYETPKTEAPCHCSCGTIKIPPCPKAGGAEHRSEI